MQPANCFIAAVPPPPLVAATAAAAAAAHMGKGTTAKRKPKQTGNNNHLCLHFPTVVYYLQTLGAILSRAVVMIVI
jgi:hypothetical protein